VGGVEHVVVTTTASSRAEAEALATALLDDRLVACVQFVVIDSWYHWQGAIAREPEVLLVAKTRADLYGAVEAAIVSRHPYDVPEVVCTPITAGHRGYLDWVEEATGEAPPTVSG
jgi:periplasmic divalent cation tolerance protein